MKKRLIFFMGILCLGMVVLGCAGCGKKAFSSKDSGTEHTGTESGTSGENGASGENAASGEKDDMFFVKDSFYCDVVMPKIAPKVIYDEEDAAVNNFPLEFYYLYRGKKPEIEFLGFEDPLAKAAYRGMANEKQASEKEFQGYKPGKLIVWINVNDIEKGEVIRVNSVRVSVNGKEMNLDTTDAVCAARGMLDGDELSECVSIGGVAALTYRSRQIQGVMLSCRTSEDIEVEKVEFRNYLTITGGSVNYGSEGRSAEITKAFPISLSAGEQMEFFVDADLGDQDPFSIYVTDFLVHYSDAEGKKTASAKLVFYPNISADGRWEEFVTHALEIRGK